MAAKSPTETPKPTSKMPTAQEILQKAKGNQQKGKAPAAKAPAPPVKKAAPKPPAKKSEPTPPGGFKVDPPVVAEALPPITALTPAPETSAPAVIHRVKGFDPARWKLPEGAHLRTEGSQGNSRGPWCDGSDVARNGEPEKVTCSTCKHEYTPNVRSVKGDKKEYRVPFHPIPGAIDLQKPAKGA